MTQIKDYPERISPEPDDVLYLATAGDTDYRVALKSILGEMITEIVTPLYELLPGDKYHTVRMSFLGSKVLTIPLEATTTFIPGTVVRIRNASEGTLSISGETIAVKINTKTGLNIIPRGEAKLVYIGLDVWDVIGDLS